MPAETLHDVAVIGAGAAGVSAAIECHDIKLDVVVLDAAAKVGGQIDQIPHDVRNVAPAPDGNEALVAALARHASTLDDRVHLGQSVTRVDLAAGLVEAGTHRYRARSVLVATGSSRRELENAPDGSFGGDVTYLVEPHLARFAGRPMAVFGGGDSALLDALELAGTGSVVTLIHRSPGLTARADVVERLRSEDRITEMAGWTLGALVGSDHLEALRILEPSTGEHRQLEVAGVVLKLGRAPSVDLVRDQLDLGRHGGIAVDGDLRTSDPRTFAAGDVVEGAYARIATAVGQGSLAARTILNYLESGS
ncbi:MAG TPA: NAD(P)/FAD-dependent oxidoreductase [Acidimicrobiales bacterium]|jgi:thioredoxin reductase (NADPH)|nr:NAD(P)/FAD-dependent oxidoreductase [Acidimicrobiales bacterium]